MYIFANTYVHLRQHVYTSSPTRIYIFANTYIHLRQYVYTSSSTRIYIFANTYIASLIPACCGKEDWRSLLSKKKKSDDPHGQSLDKIIYLIN